MHFYLVRSDLTGFQHVHPTMASDGTWTAPLAAAAPGSYRAYANFIAAGASGQGRLIVLGEKVSIPASAAATPLLPPSTTTNVDGYTLTAAGQLMAGLKSELVLTVSRNGQPVTDLQPYLDTYGHLTAFRAGDLALAHLHPSLAAPPAATHGYRRPIGGLTGRGESRWQRSSRGTTWRWPGSAVMISEDPWQPAEAPASARPCIPNSPKRTVAATTSRAVARPGAARVVTFNGR